jgi:hypothetical protein
MHKKIGYLLKIFLPLCLLAKLALGAQWALVRAQKAVVFADSDLSAPIGSISQGKKIRVGSNALKNGSILPIAVARKIAFIRTADLQLNEFKIDNIGNKELKEHQYYDMDGQQLEDDFKKNNFIGLQLHQFSAGSGLKQLSEELGGVSQNKNITAILIQFEHRPKMRRFTWALSLGYYSLSQENLAFQAPTIEFSSYYILFGSELLSAEMGGGILFSGDTRLKATGAETARGAMYGTHICAQIKLFPQSKWGAVMGLGLRNLHPLNVDVPIPNSSTEEVRALGKMGGAEIYAGVAYKF